MTDETVSAAALGLPSRRFFLAAGSTAAVLGGLSTAANAEHADAELIAMGNATYAAFHDALALQDGEEGGCEI
jgi:hypothetical protein